MSLSPRISLSFDGRCEAAFQHYARALNGKIAFLLRWGDSPMAKDAPTEWAGKVFHARLEIGDTAILGGDLLPGTHQPPQGFSLLLEPNDPAEAERLFQELSENGTVRMPLQETFWARRFGVVADQFGIQWDINCENPA